MNFCERIAEGLLGAELSECGSGLENLGVIWFICSQRVRKIHLSFFVLVVLMAGIRAT